LIVSGPANIISRGNGTETKPILLTAYGEGPKPEILGSIRLTEWAKHEGNVYKHIVPVGQFVGKKTVYNVYEYDEDEVPVRLLRENALLVTSEGRFGPAMFLAR
jgi:hypothetical protein